MPQCKQTSCLYYSHRTDTCDYCLITSERRGCPVEGCTKFAPSKLAKALHEYFAKGVPLSEGDMKILTLYEQGMSDAEIAKRISKSRKLVWHWRRKMGLPSQRQTAEECSEDDV